MSIASCTSPRVSASTFPISRVMSRENSSLRFTSSSAARKRISARLGAGTRRQDLYASLAAATAASTSSREESGKTPISSSTFAGLRFSSVFPLRGATHSPLMKFLYACEADAVAIRPPGQNRVYRRAPRGVKPGPNDYVDKFSLSVLQTVIQSKRELATMVTRAATIHFSLWDGLKNPIQRGGDFPQDSGFSGLSNCVTRLANSRGK